MRVACSGTINGKPVVSDRDGKLTLGQGLDGETPFISRNQNAIAPGKKKNGSTLIGEDAVATGKARYGEQAKYPNDTMANAHAEVAFMQHAHDAGLIKAGDSVTIPVTGRAVCQNCREHLPLMAKKTGIRFMTVIDKTRNIVYYWHQGMDKLTTMK